MTDLDRRTGTENREVLTPAKLFGVVDPLVTPFLNGTNKAKLDKESLYRDVRHVLPHVNALFVAGNAGEGPLLNVEDWSGVVKTVIEARDKYAHKYTPVLAGVLKKTTLEVSVFSQKAQALGADGIVIAPLYSRDPIGALLSTLYSSELPVILYNNPDLQNGLELPLKFIADARDQFPSRVIGIKSSTKNLNMFKEILRFRSEGFKVFQGNTADAARAIEIGVDGIVPAEATIAASLFDEVYKASKGIGDHSMSQVLGALERFLEDFNIRKERAELKTAPMIKRILVEKGVFTSARMYKQ